MCFEKGHNALIDQAAIGAALLSLLGRFSVLNEVAVGFAPGRTHPDELVAAQLDRVSM